MKSLIAGGALCLALTSCAASSTMRTSQDTVIIKTRAAPICGTSGAMKVAQKQAAIETLKSGYDRYMILGNSGYSDVRAHQMPGTYNTVGTANIYGNYGTYNATTTYTPGPTFVTGGHKENLVVKMFKDGQPGSASALSAKETLGPKWEDAIKSGVFTCAG